MKQANPFPNMIPSEVWDAKKRAMDQTDPIVKQQLWHKHSELRLKYVIDAKTGEYLKDENGEFLKN